MITVQQPLFTHGVLNKITATCITRTRLSQFVHDLSLSVTFSQCESHHLQEHVALLIMLSGTKYSHMKRLLLVMFLLFPFWFPLSFLPFGLLSKLEYMPKDITNLLSQSVSQIIAKHHFLFSCMHEVLGLISCSSEASQQSANGPTDQFPLGST